MATSRKMSRLIAKSSLGTPAARSIRARTPSRVAYRLVRSSSAAARPATVKRST